MRHRKGYITRQAKRLTDGEINRRRFVMSALSAGVTLPTALSLASRAEARTPRRGGLLRIATAEGAASDGLAPQATDNAFTRLLAFTRGNTLTEILPDGTLTGELAKAYAASPDGRTWAFDLRENVRFHDGRSLTARDVEATLFAQASLLPGMSDVRSDEANKVIVTLDRPDPAFPRRLADPRLIVLPADGDARLGTGPYRLEEFEPGVRARFIRNEDYWKPGRAHVDAVHLIALPDLSSRQHALMAGDVDYADGIDPRALAFLQRAPDVEVLDVAAGRHIALTAPGPSEPGTAHVLDTLRNALPYRELIDRILLGHGAPGRTADAACKAAEVVAQGTLRLAVHDTGVPRTMEAARLIATRLTERGVSVELIPVLEGEPSTQAHAHICWRRSDAAAGTDPENAVVAVWANDISAHRAQLTHGHDVATNLENDGARLAERWWFA